jgi:tripartite-type tricarboxylate transporter receptor subunit TctC
LSSGLSKYPGIAVAVALLCGAVVQADAAEFYQGKQIRLIVSTPPSGAYDAFARLMAPVFADHIPGHPSIFVENMGGSAGLQAANYLANSAPKDGTVIGAVQNNIPTAPLLIPENAKFDADAFLWIGSITSDPFIGYVWGASKLQTYEDAKKQQSIMGAPAVRSYSAQMAQISNALFGTRFKIVIGYTGSNEVKLAMERGEIDGTFGNSWSSLKTQDPDWISEHKIRIITQFSLKADRELSDVPMFLDQAKTEDDRQMLELLQVQQVFAKPYLAPPGIPADRLAILRKAFDDTINDPKFLGEAKNMKLDVLDPMSGEELAALIAKVSKTSPVIIKRVKDIFDAPQKEVKQ